MKWSRLIGPGFLVTAAFIGPGTVTTASQGGASFGFALMWAVLFSAIATIVLQEMAARLGLATRQGLGEAVRSTFQSAVARALAVGLVVAAIFLGNSAFQTGNITGAASGLEIMTGVPRAWWVLAVGAAALCILAWGNYRVLEITLIGMVILMSLVFVATAVLVRPDPSELARGFMPSLPSGSEWTVVALIGTTVVPYNLFLHASSVQKKWDANIPVDEALRASRADTALAVGLGGVITLAILATAAAAFFGTGVTITDPAKLADQLEPLLGSAAPYLFSAGFCAAGLSSAITAPLAASYATAGALGWPVDLRSWRLRAVWGSVIAAGALCALVFGRTPLAAIVFAQAANGLLLPLMAIFLLIAVNRGDIMGAHRNGWCANVLGVVVVLIAAGLGVYQLTKVMGTLLISAP